MKRLFPLFACAAALLPLNATAESAPPSSPTEEQAPTRLPLKLEFLRVHPQSDYLVAEGATEVAGYKLAHNELFDEASGAPLLDKSGKPRALDFWIETAEAATKKGYYLCEDDIAVAEADPARPDVINLIFTAEGSEKMQELTSSFEIGRERLAIVINGKVYAAPVVQDTLSRQICITGLNIPGERDWIVRVLQAVTVGRSPAPEESAEEDETIEIVVDTALSKEEQQEVRTYVQQRLLADARLLQTMFADGGSATYGTLQHLQVKAMKSVSTEGLPDEYRAYIHACVNSLEKRGESVAAIADLPILDANRTAEQKALVVKSAMKEAKDLAELAEAHPQADAFIGHKAIWKVRHQLITRASFQDAWMMEILELDPDNEEEYKRLSVLRMAELLEAEVRYMLGEDVEAPSHPRPKPAMGEELIRTTYSQALVLLKETIDLLKGITDTPSADAAVARLAEIDEQLSRLDDMVNTYDFPTKEEIQKALGPLYPEIEQGNSELRKETSRLRDADCFKSDALLTFFENCLFF